MTDEPSPEPTEAQLDRIRAALAAGRVTEPLPDAVAARLDDALAHLVQERADVPATRQRSVASSAGRGGRARAWTLVAAAAAGLATVVVLSIPALRPSGSSDSSASGSAEGMRDKAGSSASRPSATGPSAALPQVSRGAFRADVRRLLGYGPAALRSAGPTAPSASAGSTARSDRSAGSCVPDPAPSGGARQVQVLFDGRPAILEVFAVSNGTRLVRAVSCDGAETLASTRVPAS